MEKLGKILLLILNILVDIFLVAVVLFFFLWLFFDITPDQLLFRAEKKLDTLSGQEIHQKALPISKKYQQRAHRKLYIQDVKKNDEKELAPATQPYRYEQYHDN